MVTMDGTEIRPGGSFAGGSNRGNSTTFIKPELEALLGEIAELSSQLQEQESLVATKKVTVEQARESLDTIKEEESKLVLLSRVQSFVRNKWRIV